MTEKQLIRNEWWWRKDTKDRIFDEETFTTKMRKGHKDDVWKRNGERHAWAYELMRRHDRSADLPPFPKLDPADQLNFGSICEPAPEVIAPVIAGVGLEGMDIEYDPKIWGQVWINFAAPDSAIIKAVKKERAERGITQLDELRGRELSWRWPELMDLDFFKLVSVWGDNDRSKLSRARKLAKIFFQNFKMQFSP